MKMRTQRWLDGAHGSHAAHLTYVCLALLCADVRADDAVSGLRALLGGKKPAEAGPKENAPPRPARLRWNNGESMDGEIVDGNGDALRWKTSLFAEPLELRWQALRRIDQPFEAVEVKGAFGFVFRDGSYLSGDLIAMTDTTLTLRSARHGDAVLKRAEILSMRRLRGGELIASGPAGDSGWSMLTDSGAGRPSPGPGIASSLPMLTGGTGGALELPYWNRSATLKTNLPEMIDAEFRVRSTRRPDFRLGLASTGSVVRQLSIETWDDQLVVCRADDFKFIRKIADDERVIALRVCWDTQARTCAIFASSGELLAEWQPPDPTAQATAGIDVFNKGRDLALEFLRVRKWDGKPPPKVDVKQPRIELANGDIVAGEVLRLEQEVLRVKLQGQTTEQDMKLADVDALFFSGADPKTVLQEAVLSYADGTRIGGKIDSIQGGSIAVRTSFADVPVKSGLDGLRQIFLEAPSSEGRPAELRIVDKDRIAFASAALHGALVADGTGRPKWLPIGGVKPASLKDGDAYEITRAFPAGSKLATASALFFTSGGDILPGALRSIDRSGVEMNSEIMDGKKLPAGSLDAVQFGASSQIDLTGFTDPGWQVIKGGKNEVRRDADSLSLEPGASIGHVAALQSSEVKFSLAYGGMSTVRLRLFCAGLDAEKSTNVMISHWGSHVYSGVEAGDDQLLDQARTGTQSGKPVAVRLVVKEKTVDLSLNGVVVQTYQVPSAKRLGSGLVIEPSGLWGNTVSGVSLTNFTAHSVPGVTWLPDVNAETKTQALMVPRFRRDDPARHAIIAANGDVLRGEIVSATTTHFLFRSGLEELRVPRDRVKAAIWLKKPAEDTVPAAAPSSTQKSLDQKIARRTRYGSGSFSSLIGNIEREAPGLKIKKPAKEDTRTFDFQFGGQTVGEALEQVCALFGLRHRIDKDDAVVIERALEIPAGLVQKSRWLKVDAFPDGAVAQEILAAKGVPFPTGASAAWQPLARALTMTNTPENQARLDGVLAADIGGSLGSPTHWLLLTSGARLGLAVDKFEPESLLGHHPIYGTCHVPMAQVYVMRTSSPEPTAIMRSLGDWRLVHAPEPVLPESGGENSPLLGKPAPLFKLPLLGGGEFDLAQEKGRVVVLDFWATWCGPCVKSLPALIEVLSAFPSDKVKLIGANQGEGGEVVRRFLDARNLKLTVAMDGNTSVARQFGVDGIPHTVIIGPDGKVAWVKSGYSPEDEIEAANVVRDLLAKP